MAVPSTTQERIDLMTAVLAGSRFRIWRKKDADTKGHLAGKILANPEHVFDWEDNNYELIGNHEIIFLKADGTTCKLFPDRDAMQADTTIPDPTIEGRFISGSKELMKLAKDANLVI